MEIAHFNKDEAGIIKVYLLQHLYKFEENEEESSKILGIYETMEQAEQAVERFKLRPGFKEFPNDFFIDPYVLGKDYWESGFSLAGLYVKVVNTHSSEIEYSKVYAIYEGDNTYYINKILEPEKRLEFNAGDIVTAEIKQINGKNELVAVKLIN